MKTKNRILSKSLELFNKEGIKDVTLRKISLALGISQGNLNYHYKTKGEIITTLYFQLVGEMDVEMERKVEKEQPILSFLYESSFVSMTILYKYKFILKDLYRVLSTDEKLEQHYFDLQTLRKQQYLLLFEHMMQQKLLRAEEFEGEYGRLYQRMNILGDNWINAANIFLPKGESVVTYYHGLLFEVIYPYLTDEGKEQFLALQQL